MAVLLKVEERFPDGATHVVPMLYPTGRAIGKEEREQAERLDSFLAQHVPAIVNELTSTGKLSGNGLAKWHGLGVRLSFVDDPSLVSINDRDAGAIWLALRQHLPESLLPAGDEALTPAVLTKRLSTIESQRRLGKRHDHFERCYKLGKYSLQDVAWLTWSDFDAFLESPGLERDPRILPLLGSRARKLKRRLKRTEIRAVFKTLREAIPTKHKSRDTTSIPESDLRSLIDDAFSVAGV